MRKLCKYYSRFFIKYISFRLSFKISNKLSLAKNKFKIYTFLFLIHSKNSRYFFQFPFVKVWIWLLTPILTIVNKLSKVFRVIGKLGNIIKSKIKIKIIKTFKSSTAFDLYVKKGYYMYKVKNYFIFITKIYFEDSPLISFVNISKYKTYNVF